MESRLSQSLDSADLADALADAAIARGLHSARRKPEHLPPAETGAEVALNDSNDPNTGLMQTRIRFIGRLGYCPGLAPAPAESLHFEIAGTGQTPSARAERLQGFSICRTDCATSGCAGEEYPAQPTYHIPLTPDAEP
jgi:hypothetical protein